MDGRQYFFECCEELGLNHESLFKIGVGETSQEDRFVYSCPPHSRKESVLYMIKYFKKEKLYIAWNLKECGLTRKRAFTLQKSSIVDIQPNKILRVAKPIEHKGWGEEIVLVFSPNCVKDFLNIYVKGDN